MIHRRPARPSGRVGDTTTLRHPILRGLHRDVGWSGTHDTALVVLSLTSFLLLQRALTPAEYGAYFGIYALIGVFSALTISGITFAALQQSVAEPDSTGEVLRSFLSLVLIVGVVAVFVAGAIAWLSLSVGPVEIAAIAVGELLAAGVIAVAAVLTHARAGFGAAVRVRLPVIALRLSVLVTLFTASRLDIRNLALGNLIAFSAYAAFLLMVHLPRQGYRVSLGIPTRGSARSSVAFAVPTGAGQLQTDGDKYLLNVFRYDVDGGVYGVAYRIVQLATLPIQAIENAAFHRFLPDDDGSPGVHTGRARAFFVFMLGVGTLAAFGLIVLLPLVDRLLDPSYDRALDIVPWLVLLVPLAATRSIPLNALLGLGRADVRMMIYIAAGLVTLVCYLALIPSMSWRGAVIATFVGESFLACTGWLALKRLQGDADRRRSSAETNPA